MSLKDNQHDLPDPETEELTAYLDGELDDATQLAVESRLNSDPDYLAELQSLQQTWETLDLLPAVDADKSFTQTTMELIVADVKSSGSQAQRSWSRWIPAIALALVACGLFTAGFVFQRSTQRLPDKILVEHLPAIERYEVFQAIDLDLPLLEQLNHHSLFPHLHFDPIRSFETPQDRTSVTADDYRSRDSLADRKDRIENLDIEQKSQLKEKLDRFLALPEQEQQAIIEFQQSLDSHPLSDQLQFVLNEYYFWLKSLDPGERSRLQDMPADEFLEAILQMRVSAREENARRIFEQAASTLPGREDADYIFNWYQILIGSKEDDIRSYFPKIFNQGRQRLNLKPLAEDKIRKHFDRRELSLIASIVLRTDREFIEKFVIQEQEMDLLVSGLSEETRDMLFSMPDQMRRETIFTWIDSINEVNRRTLKVSDDELYKFAARLPASERDQLNRLPVREYTLRLMELFRKKNSSLPAKR